MSRKSEKKDTKKLCKKDIGKSLDSLSISDDDLYPERVLERKYHFEKVNEKSNTHEVSDVFLKAGYPYTLNDRNMKISVLENYNFFLTNHYPININGDKISIGDKDQYDTYHTSDKIISINEGTTVVLNSGIKANLKQCVYLKITHDDPIIIPKDTIIYHHGLGVKMKLVEDIEVLF